MKTLKVTEIYKSDRFVYFSLIGLIIFALFLFSSISGCSNDSPVQPQAGSSNMGFSSASGNEVPVTNPVNMLLIQEAKIMIRDLKIISEDEGNEEHEEEIEMGPIVLTLDLDTKANLVKSIILPEGIYHKVKFQVHKLEENEPVPDPDFADANGRYSVVVKGIYNGNSFVYKSKVTANQMHYLQKPLSITLAGFSNITFYASPLMWFYDSNGNLLDPNAEFNRHLIDDNIRDNIKEQIRVFVDDDRNGIPDN